MANWSEVLHEMAELQNSGNPTAIDIVRRKYLKALHEHTGRNVIAYYSGWLQRPESPDCGVNDKDKNAFMATIHGLDRSKGLDLILHTPGGDLAATESLVDYLHRMFGNNIRAIIPQLAMSAGTMMALSTSQIVMGKQSNLGPIDPQMNGLPCQGIMDEFLQAKREVAADNSSLGLWQTIISKYHPTLLGECANAIEWSEELVEAWLERNMCNGKGTAAKVLKVFSDHSAQKSHARHISIDQCKSIGLNILDMESDQPLQDAILTSHHCFMHTLSRTPTAKIVENHDGVAYVEQMLIQMQ